MGTNHFLLGTECGITFAPEHPGTPSSGSGLHLFFLSSSLFPSKSSLIIRHVLLAMESLFFFFLEYDVWEKDYHCSEVLWSWETRRMLITEITEALMFFC